MALTNNIKKLNGYVNLDEEGSGTVKYTGANRGVYKRTPSAFDDQVDRSNTAYDELAKGYQASLSEYQKTIADQQKQIDELLAQGYGKSETYLDNAYKSNTDALMKNYNLQSKNNDDQYRRNVGELQANRDRQLQSANATLELLSKYLPTMGRDSGLDMTGAASGALLRMQNANRSEVGAINANYDTNKVSLDNAYGERRTSLDTNYNTTKAGYDTAHDQAKADLTKYLTDAQASNAQHYGDLSANAGYETGNKVAEAGLDKYLSEAEIRETERKEAREDAQLAEKAAREDTAALETYLLDPDGYINKRIGEITSDTDEKISQADYDTLEANVMQYYDSLSENGKMAVDNLLADAKATIRSPEAQEAMDKVSAKEEADALLKAQYAARLADPDAVQVQFQIAGGSEKGNLSSFTADVGDSNKKLHHNFTINGTDGRSFPVECGYPASVSDNELMNSEYRNVYGDSPSAGQILIYKGKIYCYTKYEGQNRWVTVQARQTSDTGFKNACTYFGIKTAYGRDITTGQSAGGSSSKNGQNANNGNTGYPYAYTGLKNYSENDF